MQVKLLSCPVPAANREVGVLALVRSKDGADFSNGDRNLASVIASHIGIVLRNRHLLQGMQRFSEQMASALIEAIEAKDAYTGGHSQRVRDLSVRIGRTMSLRSEQIDSLSWGSLLHDVGKVAIPDAILSKPCRLTEEEYTFIKVHPERSYEILRHIELLSQEALDGARFHQERFDGKGYPRGLRGYEIPLSARIIAVADTYDAMTTSRAYRPGQDHEAAVQEIVKVAGSQLDPEVVGAFQRLCTDDLAWISSTAASGGER
jgi:HD-GYP domain-containing protein (c-di-GMP phosphodiesterase class II)